jgi:hypothetical protein
MNPPSYDYCVPVTIHGQAPGQTASVTLYMLVYAQPSDVAAQTALRIQLTEMTQLLSPNEFVSEFEIGQPMAVSVGPFAPPV